VFPYLYDRNETLTQKIGFSGKVVGLIPLVDGSSLLRITFALDWTGWLLRAVAIQNSRAALP